MYPVALSVACVGLTEHDCSKDALRLDSYPGPIATADSLAVGKSQCSQLQAQGLGCSALKLR